MNQSVIDHTRILAASRTTREAVCQAYGIHEPTPHELEATAHTVTGTAHWPSLRRLMRHLSAWYQQATTVELTTGQRVIWKQACSWNPRVVRYRGVVVEWQRGQWCLVRGRTRRGGTFVQLVHRSVLRG